MHNVGFFTRQAKALEESRMEEAIRVRRVSILDLDAPMKLRTDLPLFRDLILSVSERESDPALTPWLSSPIKPTFHNASDGLGYKNVTKSFQNWFRRTFKRSKEQKLLEQEIEKGRLLTPK